MTRYEIIKDLQKNMDGKSQRECGEFIDAFVKTVTDALVRGEEVKIFNFGTFKVREVKAFNGYDPATGKRVDYKKRYYPTFKVGKGLKDCIVNK